MMKTEKYGGTTLPLFTNATDHPVATEDTTTIQQEISNMDLLFNREEILNKQRNMDQAILVGNEVPTHVQNVKQCRKDGDAVLQQIKALPPSREISLAITNIQQGIMWLGMELKRINEPNPYPESYDPTSTRIEPTADGLKF